MNEETTQKIVIVDIKMPFWSIVTFMVKFVIATIPAFTILFFIGLFFFSMLAGIGAGIGHH